MIKLIKFYTDICAPCRMMNPIVKAVVDELDGVHCESINATEQPDVAKQFNVTNVPTFVVLRGTTIVGQKTGMIPKPALKSWLEGLNSP